MSHILNFKAFENLSENSLGTNKPVLVIIDVQKSFSKYFTEMYIHELKKYCKEFNEVYQIWDNHVDGKNVDKDYLYSENPIIPDHDDLYDFPNQKDIIEKRYLYDVDVNYFSKILSPDTFSLVKSKEDKNELKRGDYFETMYETIIVYIGNNHKWIHVGKKLLNFLTSLKDRNAEVIMVGGAASECFLDVFTSAKAIGVNVRENFKFIYSARHCPIK